VTIAIVFLLVVVVAVGSAWAARQVRHPESTASHDDGSGPTTTSDDLYGGDDRPAGPDVEDPVDPAPAHRPEDT
jgi:hypothetical protein